MVIYERGLQPVKDVAGTKDSLSDMLFYIEMYLKFKPTAIL